MPAGESVQNLLSKRDRTAAEKVVGWMLLPLALIYRISIAIRRLLYTTGILSTAQLPVPVISIGSITAGGSGKTPVLMHICKYLVSRRKTVLVLTRGYGGPQDTAIITDPADERLHRLSDEVRLMASNLNATIAIGADRMSAFNAAAKTGVSDVVILDDGFQHWQIHRDLDIVVLDATAPFGSEFMLPSGNLREPRTSIARSNFIILTKTDLSEDLPGELARVNHISGDKPIVLSGYQIDSISTLQPGQSLRITDLSHSRLLAFAAIANPRSFFNLLAKCGIPAAHTLSYRDHHIYTQPDVDHILATARAAKCDGLVATEKDAVKLVELDFGGMPVYVIRIRLQITDGLGNLHSLIDGVIDGKP